MRRSLLDIVVCPVCKAALTLAVSREEIDDVVEGTLTCTACGEVYQIEDGIAVLLPPELR